MRSAVSGEVQASRAWTGGPVITTRPALFSRAGQRAVGNWKMQALPKPLENVHFWSPGMSEPCRMEQPKVFCNR
jgi:hypothetical protein